MRQRPFAAHQFAAEFGLEGAYRTGQRRLRDIAALRRLREVQRIAQRQEVADLMHFHAIDSAKRGRKWSAAKPTSAKLPGAHQPFCFCYCIDEQSITFLANG